MNARKFAKEGNWAEISENKNRSLRKIIYEFAEEYHKRQVNKNESISLVRLSLPDDVLKRKAKEWAESRSDGDESQDRECEYDYYQGARQTREEIIKDGNR